MMILVVCLLLCLLCVVFLLVGVVFILYFYLDLIEEEDERYPNSMEM